MMNSKTQLEALGIFWYSRTCLSPVFFIFTFFIVLKKNKEGVFICVTVHASISRQLLETPETNLHFNHSNYVGAHHLNTCAVLNQDADFLLQFLCSLELSFNLYFTILLYKSLHCHRFLVEQDGISIIKLIMQLFNYFLY